MKSVFHWDKIVYCQFWYGNQFGNRVDKLPDGYTIYGGQPVSDDVMLRYGVSELDHAKWLGLLDIWTPYVQVGLYSNQHLVYKGDRALAIWKDWCGKCYKKSKSNAQKRNK